MTRMTREAERITQEEYEMKQFYEAEALKHAEEVRLHQDEVRRHQERVSLILLTNFSLRVFRTRHALWGRVGFCIVVDSWPPLQRSTKFHRKQYWLHSNRCEIMKGESVIMKLVLKHLRRSSPCPRSQVVRDRFPSCHQLQATWREHQPLDHLDEQLNSSINNDISITSEKSDLARWEWHRPCLVMLRDIWNIINTTLMAASGEFNQKRRFRSGAQQYCTRHEIMSRRNPAPKILNSEGRSAERHKWMHLSMGFFLRDSRCLERMSWCWNSTQRVSSSNGKMGDGPKWIDFHQNWMTFPQCTALNTDPLLSTFRRSRYLGV